MDKKFRYEEIIQEYQDIDDSSYHLKKTRFHRFRFHFFLFYGSGSGYQKLNNSGSGSVPFLLEAQVTTRFSTRCRTVTSILAWQ
jgi:hypothetical protein